MFLKKTFLFGLMAAAALSCIPFASNKVVASEQSSNISTELAWHGGRWGWGGGYGWGGRGWGGYGGWGGYNYYRPYYYYYPYNYYPYYYYPYHYRYWY